MKTLRRLLAVALLVGSYHVGMAQNNSIPQFKTDAEKQAWIDANPELNVTKKAVVQKNPTNVRSEERFSSEAEKKAYLKENSLPSFSSTEEKRAWIEANPERYEALKSTKTKVNKPATQQVVNKERFSSVEEKEAWLEQNKK